MFKGKRVLSLFLALIMILSLVPMTVFGAKPGNIGGGSGDGDSSDVAQGGWGAELKKYNGMRFSLYFAEGAWTSYEEYLEAERSGEAQFKPMGDIVETYQVDTEGLRNKIDKWSNMSVFERMAQDNMGKVGGDGFIKDDYGSIVKDINSMGWNGTFPKIISSVADPTKYSVFFTGLKEATADNWEQADVKNSVVIANKITNGKIEITEDGFKNGYYVDKAGVRHEGAFKLFIEPVMGIKMNNIRYAVTIRDMIAYENAHPKVTYKGTNESYVGLYSAYASFSKDLGSAVYLIDDEPIIDMKGKIGGGNYTKNDNFKEDSNFYNSAGVGVITGFPRQGKNVPKLIKTYVQITGLDANGNVTYKQAAEPVVINMSGENYYIEQDLSKIKSPLGKYQYTNNPTAITNVPKINIGEYVQKDDLMGYAVLNDIVSAIPEMLDDTNWINEYLPKDSQKELRASVEEVPGSATGLVTNDVKEYQNEYYVQLESGEQESLNKFMVRMFVMSAAGDVKELSYNLATSKIVGVNSEVYTYFDEILLGKVDRTTGQVVKNDPGTLGVNNPSVDNIVLRYVVVPEVVQKDVIEIYFEKDKKTQYVTVGPRPLDRDFDGVNIQIPEVELPEGADPMEIVEWVTNPEIPYKDISNGKLPEPTNNGKTGTTLDKITDYPVEPIIHNLYVKWRVVVPYDPDDPTKPSGQPIKDSVPEWRLSKYRGSLVDLGTPIQSASMFLTLAPDTTTHVTSTLSPSGSYNFDTINPNGQKTVAGYNPNNMNMKTITTQWLSAYGGVPANTFYHSKAVAKSSSSISHDKAYAHIKLDGILNQIKSFDTGKINAASWKTDGATKSGLEQHNIKTDVKPIGYSGGDAYDKSSVLKYGIYNKDTYTHQIANYRHKCGRWSCWCRCYLSTETLPPPESSKVSYITADYNMTTTFERYVQKNTDNQKFTVAPEIKKDNGLTTIKYQLKDTLTIYPEVGMLFDNDADQESIKWVVGDQGRKISPVVYQTLQHKVWVEPTSVGTSVATDTRALQTAQKLGEANKQVIHKGAGVNNTFRLYRDDGKDSKAILTVKTFALDFKDKSALNQVDVKSAWGNGSYNSETQHDKLVNSIKGANKADATEKLLVDTAFGGNAEYVGGEKRQKTASYNIMSYNGKTTTVFEHELIVRGGYVIGVNLMSRTDGSKKLVKIEDLKKTDEALYNALVNMNLYNEKNDRNQTVFKTFEHLTGDTLTEAKYASDLANARKTVDKIDTPAYASVATNKPWYSEDTTVLVVKEYVTNFEIPSIAFGDKLSMSVADLTTPIQKEQFYSKMGKGYTYLKYDLPIASMYDGVDKTSCYFEFTSLPSDAFEFGQQKTDYLVPNVSITDTTRIN